jgi:hypothetical protein
MKLRLYFFTLIFLSVTSSCDDNESPKAPPEIATSAVSEITTSSAKSGGTITSNGNSEITKSGVVYSSNVQMPTIADDKVENTVTDGSFSAVLENLKSGTTYHVRAFAINSIGTSYGAVVDFTTGNQSPLVTELSITGTIEVNKTISVTYKYSDAENDPQGATSFQWYQADDASGTGEKEIAGATSSSLTIQDAQNGKYLRVSVKPKATSGATDGLEVKSAFVGAVGEATTVTFSYNNQTVNYGIITSSATGRKWLDRNLGASKLASKVDDYDSYGDLFQWGRLPDGHQLVARSGAGDSDASGVTGITSTTPPYATTSSNVPTTNMFIIDGSSIGDWRQPQDNTLWQQDESILNNPCPVGWRIPTIDEWTAEALLSAPDAFTKLKLTYSGQRNKDTGVFELSNTGRYWSSTVRALGGTQYSRMIVVDGTSISNGSFIFHNRAEGLACRCIKIQ